ncbi:hypothetical protein ILUMI_04091 [Ignelater luminosus]|uniref:Lysophospholipid acyltransferase 7 n=1 Tax=Ignelater luminosus TaxID=2038154 RepID=A0A8K0DF39_IGNLU|nr:hypothetical protein ILUMI_04091 [Ignelater luminosus]
MDRFFVNCVIISWLPRRYCHLVSFTYTFIHLLFTRAHISSTYFGNPFLPYHATVTEMMMTLKLVGLAFDVNHEYLLKKKLRTNTETSEEFEKDFINPNCMDMFHYTFSFMGIIAGPHYRYKTFIDFFDLPFSVNVPKNKQVIRKLAYLVLYLFLMVLVSNIWPIPYAFSEEFYNSRSWLYRLWYSWTIFLNFRLRVYSGTILAESICIMTGLGAYPSITEPRSGHGPTKAFRKIKEIFFNIPLVTKIIPLSAGKSVPDLVQEEYSFETIQNMNPYVVESCTTSREEMKNWNMCIQYWLVATVYKRFPYKKFRTSATMFVSALWHGIYLGYYICIASVPLYLPVEDLYVELFLNNNNGKILDNIQFVELT